MSNNIESSEKTKYSNLGYFLRKRIFALVFLIALLAYSGLNLLTNYEIFEDAVVVAYNKAAKDPLKLQGVILSLEDTLNTEILERMKFLEIFSFTQKVLAKREVNNFDIIRDETGSLHYASFYKERDKNSFEYAQRVKRLKDYVSKYDTDVIFVVPPSKFVTDDSHLMDGMPVNDPQITVDEMVFYLNRLGIDTLDLNQYLPNETVPYEDAFFKTDHHWTIPAAFEATKVFTDTLNEKYGYNLDCDKYLDTNSFIRVEYKNGMLGSMGRRTGACYSGVENITVLYPDFKVNFDRVFSNEQGGYSHYRGDIIGTLILPQVLQRDTLYSDSQYPVYLNGVRSYDYIKNESNPEGLKVLIIRDSYFSPVIAFFAPMVGQIDAVWSLADESLVNIEEQIKSDKYDLIVVEMYPYNIGEEAFHFFVEEE